LQQITAANLALDTSASKCIMLQRTKLVAGLQPFFVPFAAHSIEPV
jgi:hypothetical protein